MNWKNRRKWKNVSKTTKIFLKIINQENQEWNKNNEWEFWKRVKKNWNDMKKIWKTSWEIDERVKKSRKKKKKIEK